MNLTTLHRRVDDAWSIVVIWRLIRAFGVLAGLRLLVTPFPQQQYNLTEDRLSEKPSRGAAWEIGPGVSDILIGFPGSRTVPTSGCS